MGRLSLLVHARAKPPLRKRKRSERMCWLGDPDPVVRVAGLIRDLRIDAGLMARELAFRMGVARNVVTRDEMQPYIRKQFGLDLIARYAAALELEPGVILVALDEVWCAGALREEARVAEEEAKLRRAGAGARRRWRSRALVR